MAKEVGTGRQLGCAMGVWGGGVVGGDWERKEVEGGGWAGMVTGGKGRAGELVELGEIKAAWYERISSKVQSSESLSSSNVTS